MRVILHIGAHRCATTSFQHFLRQNSAALGERGLGFWGPLRTRGGLLRGIGATRNERAGERRRDHADARERIRKRLDRGAARGVKTLLVSDENMMGSVRQNVQAGSLYGDAGSRVADFAQAFGDRLSALALNIRALDEYWVSALGYHVARTRAFPDNATLAQLAGSCRGWRDVIVDLARAVGGVPLLVLPFEVFAGRPGAQLDAMAETGLPTERLGRKLNATPDLPRLRRLVAAGGPDEAALPTGDGPWQPFTERQRVALRERHAADMAWLAEGADGLACLRGNATATTRRTEGARPADNGLDERNRT